MRDDELLEQIDVALEAVAPPVKDMLLGEYGRLQFPEIKDWVRAGREPDGAVRLLGEAKALDAVGGELRRGARIREHEVPEATKDTIRQFYAGALDRGETDTLVTLALLLGFGSTSPSPALPAPKAMTTTEAVARAKAGLKLLQERAKR